MKRGVNEGGSGCRLPFKPTSIHPFHASTSHVSQWCSSRFKKKFPPVYGQFVPQPLSGPTDHRESTISLVTITVQPLSRKRSPGVDIPSVRKTSTTRVCLFSVCVCLFIYKFKPTLSSWRMKVDIQQTVFFQLICPRG